MKTKPALPVVMTTSANRLMKTSCMRNSRVFWAKVWEGPNGPAPTQSRQGPNGPKSGHTDDPISTPTPRTVPVRLSRQRAAEQDSGGFDRHLVVLCGMDALVQKDIEAGLEGCRCLMLPGTQQPIEEHFRHHAVRVFETVRELLDQHPHANLLLQVVCPAQGPERVFAALAGLLHIANQESSRISWQIIEVDPREKDLAARLRESGCALVDTHIRYLDGKRHVATWRELDGARREEECPTTLSGELA